MSENDKPCGVCDADGCFMPATLRVAGGPWQCYAHAGAERGQYATITALMANRRDKLLHALQWSNANYGQSLTSATAKKLREAGYSWVNGDMSMAAVGRRLLAGLVHEVRHPQRQMPPDIKATAAGDVGNFDDP